MSLLIMFAFVFTNGPAVAMAMCEHEDVRAHAAALQSSDDGASIVAQSEDTAARAAAKQGTLGDAAATLLGGYILPPAIVALPTHVGETLRQPAADRLRMASRSVPPLLEPPLA
jgi:hypothetical protein